MRQKGKHEAVPNPLSKSDLWEPREQKHLRDPLGARRLPEVAFLVMAVIAHDPFEITDPLVLGMLVGCKANVLQDTAGLMHCDTMCTRLDDVASAYKTDLLPSCSLRMQKCILETAIGALIEPIDK